MGKNRLKAIGFAVALIGASAQASETASGLDTVAPAPAVQAHETIAKQTLLHSIVRDACFLISRVEGEDFGARLSASVTEMDHALQSQSATTAPPVQAIASATALAPARAQWLRLSPPLMQIAAGDFHSVPIHQILTLQLAVHSELSEMLIVTDAGAAEQSLGATSRGRTVKEQQLRVQKMTKEACFVAGGISAEGNRVDLARTASTFSDVHEAMTMAATGRERAHLEALSATWRQFHVLLDSIPTKGNMHYRAKARLSVLSDDLMRTLRALERDLDGKSEKEAVFDVSWFQQPAPRVFAP